MLLRKGTRGFHCVDCKRRRADDERANRTTKISVRWRGQVARPKVTRCVYAAVCDLHKQITSHSMCAVMPYLYFTACSCASAATVLRKLCNIVRAWCLGQGVHRSFGFHHVDNNHKYELSRIRSVIARRNFMNKALKNNFW